MGGFGDSFVCAGGSYGGSSICTVGGRHGDCFVVWRIDLPYDRCMLLFMGNRAELERAAVLCDCIYAESNGSGCNRRYSVGYGAFLWRFGSDSSSGSDSCDRSSWRLFDGTDVSEIVEQVGYIFSGKTAILGEKMNTYKKERVK